MLAFMCMYLCVCNTMYSCFMCVITEHYFIHLTEMFGTLKFLYGFKNCKCLKLLMILQIYNKITSRV